jgi:CcmD family protein
MAYLLWAFIVVWLGIFGYLYRLMKRSQALERQLAELMRVQSSPDSRTSAPTGTSGGSPTARTHTAPSSRVRGTGG